MRLAVGCALLAGFACPARADDATDSKVFAEQKFEQARDLMEAGNYDAACPLLQQSMDLDPGGGTLLNLALCHEHQGRIATAWAEYHEALSRALRDGREERASFARKRAEALAPEVPHLEIDLTQAPATAQARLDGRTLVSRELAASPLAVDPGVHQVDLIGPDGAALSPSRKVEMSAGGHVRVVLVANADVARAGPSTPAQGERAQTKRSAWFFPMLGVSAALLVASGVTGAFALDASISASAKCVASRNYCPDPTGADDAARATVFAWISTGTLIGGAVTAVVALLIPKVPIGAAVRTGGAEVFATFRF